MNWFFRTQAEIARRVDQSFPEVMQPNSVHEHSCRKRILRAGNGPGQFQTTAPISEGCALRPAQNLQESTWHFLSLIAGISAQKDMRVAGVWAINQRHRTRRRTWMCPA